MTDRYNDRIQVFDNEGKFVRKFGKKGAETGELDEPSGIVLNSEKEIIVSEYGNNRIQIFDYQGKHLRFIGTGKLWGPYHLCLDEQDNIYVGNSVERPKAKIPVFSGINGELLHSFGKGALDGPVGIAFHPISQRILVTNFYSHNVSVK